MPGILDDLERANQQAAGLEQKGIGQSQAAGNEAVGYLQNHPYDDRISSLRFGAGLLSPTKTGSFFEGLGYGASGLADSYSDKQNFDQNRNMKMLDIRRTNAALTAKLGASAWERAQRASEIPGMAATHAKGMEEYKGITEPDEDIDIGVKPGPAIPDRPAPTPPAPPAPTPSPTVTPPSPAPQSSVQIPQPPVAGLEGNGGPGDPRDPRANGSTVPGASIPNSRQAQAPVLDDNGRPVARGVLAASAGPVANDASNNAGQQAASQVAQAAPAPAPDASPAPAAPAAPPAARPAPAVDFSLVSPDEVAWARHIQELARDPKNNKAFTYKRKYVKAKSDADQVLTLYEKQEQMKRQQEQTAAQVESTRTNADINRSQLTIQEKEQKIREEEAERARKQADPAYQQQKLRDAAAVQQEAHEKAANEEWSRKELEKAEQAANQAVDTNKSATALEAARGNMLLPEAIGTGPIGSVTTRMIDKVYDTGAAAVDQAAGIMKGAVIAAQNSGSISNIEQQLYERQVAGVGMGPTSAKWVLDSTHAIAKRQEEQAAFYRRYYDKYGSLDGAGEQWRSYIKDNPVIDVDPKTGAGYLKPENLGRWEKYLTPPQDLNSKFIKQTKAAGGAQVPVFNSLDEAKAAGLKTGQPYIVRHNGALMEGTAP